MDPMKQHQKFDQIQQANNELNTLYEAQSAAKKYMCEFRPIIKTTYIQMHQVDATTYFDWKSLVAAKPKEYSKETIQ
jgi:hypothetical protein